MEPKIQATTETITGETITKIDDRNFSIEVVSTKVTPINVDELLQTRARHVAMIAEIDAKLAIAQTKGVSVSAIETI